MSVIRFSKTASVTTQPLFQLEVSQLDAPAFMYKLQIFGGLKACFHQFGIPCVSMQDTATFVKTGTVIRLPVAKRRSIRRTSFDICSRVHDLYSPFAYTRM